MDRTLKVIRFIMIGFALLIAVVGIIYASYSEERRLAMHYGAGCSFAGYCDNGVATIFCRPEVDGPIYYVNPESRDILLICKEGQCCDRENNCEYEQSCASVSRDSQ